MQKALVETSNNVARVEVIEGNVRILCLTRSSVESGKEALAQTLKAGFELGGFEVKFSGSTLVGKPTRIQKFQN